MMSLFDLNIQTHNEPIHLPILKEKGIELWIKREDQIHNAVSGNKFRKLKYNIQAAKTQNKEALITFGGAFSNHIVATAVAGRLSNLKTIGIIRGEELANNLEDVLAKNDTLRLAQDNGMHLQFISREQYRYKTDVSFINQLKKQFGDFYLVPEGGTNALAIKGCEEILTTEDKKFDYICASVGTGGTIAGLINSAVSSQKVIGFSALKGTFLFEDIQKLISGYGHWDLQTAYHFGGYAKYNQNLIQFINWFYQQANVPLDPIYTGKMVFGVLDLIAADYFSKGTTLLLIHTGGLQGINGVNQKLIKKNLETINVLCE